MNGLLGDKVTNRKLFVWYLVMCPLLAFLMTLMGRTQFTPEVLEASRPAYKALMLVMRDWWSFLYMGIPSGLLLFGLDKLFHLTDIKH